MNHDTSDASGSRKQGLIATHNPELFQQLFDDSSPEMGDFGDPVHKLYAEGEEGGHFTEEDEDKYKFISDNIEDFDEKQYSMLLDSSRKDTNSRGTHQGGQVSGRNGSQPMSNRASAKSQNTQFVVKDKRRNMTEEERDREELRREERYQARLRQKLQDFEDNQNVFIPKLELGDSDEEEKVKKKNSEPLDISLRDSLDDEPKKYHSSKPKPQLQHRDSLEDEPQNFVNDSLEFNSGPKTYYVGFEQQPGVHGNDPLSRVFHPEQQAQDERQWGTERNDGVDGGYQGVYPSDSAQHEYDQQQQHYEHGQQQYEYQIKPEMHQEQPQQHQEQHRELEIYDDYQNQYDEHNFDTDQQHPGDQEGPQESNEAEKYDKIRRKHSQKSEVRSTLDEMRRRKKQEQPYKPQPSTDYIERNKNLRKQKEGKSYTALHAKKKQPEEAVKPSSAEQLYKNQGHYTRRGRVVPAPLRKYPSESRVDEMKLRNAPHHVGPIQHRPVPIQAFQDEGTAHQGQYSPHLVYAQGGQGYDVDVNVKPVDNPRQDPGYQEAPGYQGYDNFDRRHNHFGSQGQLDRYSYGHQNYGNENQAPGYSDAHGYNYPQYQHRDSYHDYEQATQQYNYRQPYHPAQPENWSGQSQFRGSYRGSVATTERPQTPGSPYKILPPISVDDQNDSPPRAKPSPGRDVSPRREEGSYMEAFRSKKNKKIEYKKYTLNDYRKLNMEVHRGGLGPEVNGEEFINRREKAQRQQEYARLIAEKNRKDMEVAKARPNITKRPEEDDYDDAYQRRNMAKEYAKSVPKPKPRSKPPSGVAPSGSSTNRSTSDPRRDDPKSSPSSGVSRREKTPTVELVDLEALQKRHEEEKRKADMIRQNVEGVH